MSAPKGADITDAVTRSALVQLFKQFVLATPKTRSRYLLVGVVFVFAEEDGAAAASWPPAGRFRGTPACLWVVPRYVPAWVAAGSIAATRNLMAAAASANCAVLVRHACDVPVRASLHVG